MIATEIIPNLWIGDIRSALDPEFLKKFQITVIINCTTKYPFPSHNSTQIRVPVRDRGTDEDTERMYDYLCTVVPTIYDLLSKGERILIHCYAGCHRSVCLVLGFLIRYAGMTLQQAIDTLQSKWSRVGLHFSRSLCRYVIACQALSQPPNPPLPTYH
jgi:protein-tyrosine phosphatase